MDNEKKLSDITRKDWILWQWFEVDGVFGETDRMFVRGLQRNPTEALRASQEWDFLESVKGEDEIERECDDECS